MRVLLLHSEDSPQRGAWSRQRWDLIVDLGKSSPYSQKNWGEQFGCRVLGTDFFRQGVADARLVRQIFSAGRGRLLDDEGIDWWDITSLLLVPEALQMLALRRVAAEIGHPTELWSTRADWAAGVLATQLGCPLRSFGGGRLVRLGAGVGHYAGLFRRFSPAQIKQIFLDKYDSGYRWRSRFARQPAGCGQPVVLLPSAYENVSRMAADYARLLPQQSFLMVATRQSAKRFSAPANVQLRDLAAYAKNVPSASEILSLVERCRTLTADLNSVAEMQILSQAGVLDPLPGWIRNGVCARDAWREVIEREPVCGVLCGDDSNLFTRLPVLLAARRKIPTADFHHGALDGRYLLKDLPCDVYLAKTEMERDYLLRVCGLPAEKVVIAAPTVTLVSAATPQDQPARQSLIFFSEPYEVMGMRAEEFYGELLPRLLQLARENKRGLIVKLHPFESCAQRKRLVRNVLGPGDAESVTVLDGPLTAGLLAQAWCGITVDSTTVIECQQNGICCFLCGWIRLSPYEYVQQYARFGIGEWLQDATQIAEIPQRLARFHSSAAVPTNLATPADPAILERLLTHSVRQFTSARTKS